MKSKGLFSYENGVVALMSLTFGCLFFDRLALNFLMPFVAKDLQLNDSHIGLIAGGLGLAWAVSGYFLTAWAERNNRKKLVFTVAVVAFSLFSVSSGFAVSFLTLFLARVLMGFSEGVVVPLAQNFVEKESTPSRLGFNSGMLMSVGSGLFGSILAPLLLVSIALTWGWRNAFFIAGMPGLLMALLAWLYLKKRTTDNTTDEKIEGFSMRELLQIPNIRWGICVTACLFAWWHGVLPFISKYFVVAQGMAPETMRNTMTTLGVAGFLAGFIVPALSDRFGRKPILLLFVAIGIFYPLAVQFLQGSGVQLPVLFLTYFAVGCIPISVALIPSESVPEHSRARAIGLSVAVAEVFGGVIMPTVSGFLSHKIDPSAFLWVAVVMGVLCLFFASKIKETAPAMVGR